MENPEEQKKERAYGPRRSDAERERDLERIAFYYLRGWTHERIANQLSHDYYPPDAPISRRQVTSDIKTLVNRWKKSQLDSIEEFKARELERIDALEATYWEGWERSCKSFFGKTVTTITGSPDEDGQIAGTIKLQEKTEERDGDPRFLDGVQRCIEQRRKILGLDAPQKIAPTTPDGAEEYQGAALDEIKRRLLSGTAADGTGTPAGEPDPQSGGGA